MASRPGSAWNLTKPRCQHGQLSVSAHFHAPPAGHVLSGKAVRNSGSPRGKSVCAPSLPLSWRIRGSERHQAPPPGVCITDVHKARLHRMLCARTRRPRPSSVTTLTIPILPVSRGEGLKGWRGPEPHPGNLVTRAKCQQRWKWKKFEVHPNNRCQQTKNKS